MRVSVVICTLNRADALAATLECLRLQHHDDFEVVVVNGPSTDHTQQVLEPWRPHIRSFDNPERNLSISRNIGIRATTGELIAFIDDDALPEPTWLTDAIPAFDDPEVAGAGGIVFDHTGMDLQYRYSATDRLCRTVRSDHEFAAQCFPGTFQFPYLQGTNQIYRREPLLAAGGFDENIFFFGDDCDICGRLIDAGWVIRQLPNSAVHHKYLASGIRDHQRITTNWYPVVHDHTYFALRHASAYRTEDEILASVSEFMRGRVADTLWHERGGRLGLGATVGAEATCLRAFVEGYRIGREGIGRTLHRQVPDAHEFLPFPTHANARRQKVLFVTNSYTGNLAGGIARFISDLAPGMAARGHDVRVVTRAANGPAAVDLEDGVWVHRIAAPELAPDAGVAPDVPAPINAFATAALAEVERIRGWTEPDVVYTPLWDVEGIGILRHTDLPVAIQVATPIAVAGKLAGFIRGDGTDDPEMLALLDVESEVIDTADLFHANSYAVLDTMRSTDDREYGDDRWQVVSLGLVDRATELEAADRPPPDRRRLYFAGRFETRKGIDTLLDVMERVLPDHPELDVVLAGEDRPIEAGRPPVGASWSARHAAAPWIGQVTMLGVVDDDVLHREYAKSDLVVLPSRYESFGLVMVEGMMHTKPVISCDTSGVREVVRDGIDGILVTPGDVDALEQAVRRVLDDPAEAAALARAGRERFETFLSVEAFAERFEGFSERLVRRPSPAEAPAGPECFGAGESTTLDVSGLVAATVVLRGAVAARVRVLDTGERTIELRPDEQRRVRLDVTADKASVVVDEGAIVVERLIAVTRPPSGA